MKPISILYFAIALIFPIVLFTAILSNYNEGHPVPVFALCIGLFAAAGYLSAKNWKWVVWCSIVGIIEACLLSFAF